MAVTKKNVKCLEGVKRVRLKNTMRRSIKKNSCFKDDVKESVDGEIIYLFRNVIRLPSIRKLLWTARRIQKQNR